MGSNLLHFSATVFSGLLFAYSALGHGANMPSTAQGQGQAGSAPTPGGVVDSIFGNGFDGAPAPIDVTLAGRQQNVGSFGSNPLLGANTPLELQWSITPTAGVTCVPGLGEGGWNSLASAFLTANTFWISPNLPNATAFPRTVNFTLSCQRGSEPPVSRQVSVTIQSITTPPNCEGFPPPTGTTLQANPSTFALAFNRDFPLPVGNHSQLNVVNSGSFVALRFTALADTNAPLISWLWEAPQLVPGAPSTLAISRCPGDFSNRNDGCFSTDNAVGGMIISHRNDGLAFSCDLQPGQQYYVNFIHATVSNGGLGFTQCRNPSTNLPRPSCGVELTHQSTSAIEGIVGSMDTLAEIELFRMLLEQRRRAAANQYR